MIHKQKMYNSLSNDWGNVKVSHNICATQDPQVYLPIWKANKCFGWKFEAKSIKLFVFPSLEDLEGMAQYAGLILARLKGFSL